MRTPEQLAGFNDLATHYPELAKDWDTKKNGNVPPTQILFGSAEKYWWKCSHGHTHLATIRIRKEINGCPYCSGTKVLTGSNDLAITHPSIAKQWDYEKNSGVEPSQVSSGSSKKYWWRCSTGHSWEATINSRTNGRGCPYCSRLMVSTGETDLLTLSPEIVNYWDTERNHGLKPDNVSAKSTLTVWWKCSNGHRWRAMIRSMIVPKCPFCSGEKKRATKYIT